jgi:hypothetical protein
MRNGAGETVMDDAVTGSTVTGGTVMDDAVMVKP